MVKMGRSIGFAAILLSFAGPLWAAAGRIAPCNPNGPDFCGLQRPEDIAFIPGTDWMAVSNASVFINVNTRQRLPLTTGFTPRKKGPSHEYGDSSAPNCAGPPKAFHAGAIDIKRVGSEVRMVAINAPEFGKVVSPADEGGRIEQFSIDMSGGIPTAHWLGCFPVPPQYSLNAVAIGPHGEIYASHQYDRPHSPAGYPALRQKWMTHTPTGYALEWKHDAGWTKVPGTDVSFGNGVAVSYDDRVFAIAGTYCECVKLVDRRTGTVTRVSIFPVAPDNLSALMSGGFLAVGHTGVPVSGIDACRHKEAFPCGFQFAVVRIDPDGHVTYIFRHDGSRIPGASTAVLHQGRLYLSTIFANRVTVVDAPYGAPLD